MLKTTVYRTQRIELDELQHVTRKMGEDFVLQKNKIETVEDTIPKLIRQLVSE